MSDWKFHPILVGLALLMLVGVSCNSAIVPASIPRTAAPDTVPQDNPTAGAIVRSTRQTQATATRQVQLNEEAAQAIIQWPDLSTCR